MAPDQLKRKLAAILSADVKGYSRLMGGDEEWTLRTLNTYKKTMGGLIQQHQGRVVGTAGDSVLAEFGSVVDAVQCAVEIQQMLRAKNAVLPETRRMEFRIGINLGDVIEEGDSIYGDGVNIAARLEALAEAGGICISESAFQQIENKLPLRYDFLGEHAVKNIARPVRVYKARIEPAPSQMIDEKKPGMKRLSLAMLALIALVVIAAGAVLNHFVLHPSVSKTEVASKEKMANPSSNVPSIAVLPFVNMSEDPKQDYFSDGMTEDLITDLSKISGLMVIARNSTFTYKGKQVKIEQIAKELGVRYVLEGSVRRAGNEIRINAQLIDALGGQHLWAERYDGKIDKIFSLQDQITHKIVSALELKLTKREKDLVLQRGTKNVAAYDSFLKGWGHYLRFTPADIEEAIPSFRKAIDLDPDYARAYAALALIHWTASINTSLLPGLGGMFYREGRMRAADFLKKAMKQPSSIAYNVSSQIYLYRHQYQEAISEVERGLALDPSDPSCFQSMAFTLVMAGRPEEAMEYIEKGKRLDPLNPSGYFYLFGLAHFVQGDLNEAVALMEKALKLNPKNEATAFDLAAFYGLMGREQEARATLKTIRKKVMGSLNIDVRYIMWMRPFRDRPIADKYVDGLLKAGMPGQTSGYFQAIKENQLTGDKIKELFFGSTIAGIDTFIGPWWSDLKKNGGFIWRGTNSSDIGKSQIKGDVLCLQYQERFWGLEHCGTVFKNPMSNKNMKDEYFFLGDTPWTFSPVH